MGNTGHRVPTGLTLLCLVTELGFLGGCSSLAEKERKQPMTEDGSPVGLPDGGHSFLPGPTDGGHDSDGGHDPDGGHDSDGGHDPDGGAQVLPPPQDVTLTPLADTYVSADATRENYGTSSQLYVDNGPEELHTYLLFSVPESDGVVERATLRLWVTNGTADGPEVYLSDTEWQEGQTTWANRPARQGTMIADLGPVSAGWLEIDVTTVVSGGGFYSFLLLPDGADGLDFDSREDGNPPELVVEYQRDGVDPPPDGQVRCTLNPYAQVDWATWGQYKANFHTHTTESDGRDDPAQVIDLYRDGDYAILAITDHNRITWPWTDYGRDPGNLGMLAVRGDEWSSSHHVNGFFDFTRSSGSLEDNVPHVQAQGGLCQINHPGRYRDPHEWSWYHDWFRNYPACVGLEVINRNDRYSDDRQLWDNINEALFESDGRFAWGFANDDMHDPSSHSYFSFQYMLLPSLTETALRESMTRGAFYFCNEPGRSGEGKVPRLTGISLDNDNQTITLSATNYDSITWLGPGTTSVGSTAVFDFSDYANKPFVRALIRGSQGDCYTQPFGLETQ
jgi:hypothetical protein